MGYVGINGLIITDHQFLLVISEYFISSQNTIKNCSHVRKVEPAQLINLMESGPLGPHLLLIMDLETLT